MSTPAAFGFLSGIGRGIRQYNQMDYENEIQGEKTANEGTTKMLESLLNRDDVPIETKNAAAQSLMQFSQVPGQATAKHRAAAMEPVLRTFDIQREAPAAMAAHADASQLRSQPYSPGDTTPGPDGRPLVKVDPSIEARSFDTVAAGVPKRSGMLDTEEVAAKNARAFRTTYGAISGVTGAGAGTGSGGAGAPAFRLAPRITTGKNGVPQIGMTPEAGSTRTETYIGPDGAMHTFQRDAKDGRLYDNHGNDVTEQVDGPRYGVDTMTPVTTTGGPTGEETKFVDKFNAGAPGQSFAKPVPMRMLPTEGVDGSIGSVGVNPITGAQGPTIDRGKKTNSDVRRDSIQTSNTARKISTKVKLDPNAFPEVATPAGLPTLKNDQGRDVTVGTNVYTATKEPGSVLQRASAARSVMAQGSDVAQRVLDPKNADLFGKIKGRINEMFVTGANGVPVLKWVGPVGTNDPRLSEIHAGLKSLADLLTTVHGRRADEAAQNFYNTMKMVNSPEALAAAVQQYIRVAQQISEEGTKPTTKVNLPGDKNTNKNQSSNVLGDQEKAALRAIAAKLGVQPATVPARSAPSVPARQ